MQLVDDGYSHKYTNSHNSLLVDGRGQLGEGYVWFRYQDAESVDSEPRIRKVESTPTYDYMVGEGADAYSDSMKLTKFDRHLIYIKPDILIVIDDIASEEAHDFELRFFPYTQRAIQQADGSYYIQNANSKLLARNIEIDGGEFLASDVRLYSGKANTSSTTPTTASDHLAFRSVKNGATSFVTATAFSWSDNGTTPVEVTGERNGDVFTFHIMGETYTVNIATDTVKAPAFSEEQTSLLYNGDQLVSDLDILVEDGVAYVPARQFVESLNGRVEWDAAASQATFTIGGKTSSYLETETGAKLVEDKLYLTTSALERGFNLKVHYNGNSNKILAVDDVTDSSTLTEIKLDEILINGKLANGYDPDVKEYEIVNTWGTNTPTVSVIPQEMSAVFETEITPEQITVTAKSKDGTLSTDYVFHITPYVGMGNIVVQNISEPDGYENFGGNAMDGDYGTWSTSDGDDKWIIFDFGEEKTVAAAGVAPYIGTTRQAYFDFLVSNDGENWTEVYSGGSSGTTDRLEYYDLQNSKARYVQMLCHGNSTNFKNSFNEICFFDTDQFASKLELKYENTQLKVGDVQQATLTGTMFDGSPVDFSQGELTITSSNPEAATVSEDGTVTAVGNGDATISVSYTLGDMTARAETLVSVTDGTYLSEDFEAYRDGTALESPWGGTFGDVANQICAATLPDGRKVAKITASTVNITPNATYPLWKSGKMVFEGDIMSDSTVGYGRIQLYDSNGRLYSPFLQMTRNGDIVSYDLTQEYPLRTYRKNKWYHYKIELDLDTQRYNVYIDDKLYGKNLGMRVVEGNGNPYHWENGIKSFRIDAYTPDGGTVNFYLDNLKIYEMPQEGTEEQTTTETTAATE